MADEEPTFTGGCLCGAVRYWVTGAPSVQGHCYCADCRRVSGTGFIPFLAVTRDQVRVTGETFHHAATGRSGGNAIRHHCTVCGGLVYGVGEEGPDMRLYAGSLDDASRFEPTIAIFVKDRAPWAPVPEGLARFDEGPRR
jgi:hypothetical protein